MLNVVEQRFFYTERELLAILWADTRKFRYYFKCMVYTYHKAVNGKTKLTENFKCTEGSWLKIAEFDKRSKHKSGTKIVASVALSRQVACTALTDTDFSVIMKFHI
jgi:hypothetical protein